MPAKSAMSRQTAPMPVPPKTDKEMFTKRPMAVPGDDPGKPKHKIGKSR